jgi:hypothetical protein
VAEQYNFYTQEITTATNELRKTVQIKEALTVVSGMFGIAHCLKKFTLQGAFAASSTGWIGTIVMSVLSMLLLVVTGLFAKVKVLW